jgi:hypothetical protein
MVRYRHFMFWIEKAERNHKKLIRSRINQNIRFFVNGRINYTVHIGD